MNSMVRTGLIAAIFAARFADSGVAGTIVLGNRTTQIVRCSVKAADQPKELSLQPGEVTSVSVAANAEIVFQAAGESRRVEVQPDSAYSFVSDSESVRLEPVSVPRAGSAGRGATAKNAPTGTSESGDAPLVIRAKILVDEEEPAAQRIWEARIRNRLKAASDILERDCRVRIEVVDVGKWQSDNTIVDFRSLLTDFEQKVRVNPDAVAIGFTSQPLAPSGCAELGGTRGALHSHILIREWFGRTEPERLEVLLHELGHHLGAAHSADPNSVMRPKLGDGKSVSKKFRIGFDSLNLLAMCIFAETARDRGTRSIQNLNAAARERLHDIYSEIALAMPADPVIAEYVDRFSAGAAPAAPTTTKNTVEPTRDSPAEKLTPRHEAIRQVVVAIVDAAEEIRRTPADPLAGDALTEFYFRRAAQRAAELPREHGVPAYLLGLAIALDTSDMLRSNDWTRQLWHTIEPDAQRNHRLAVLGMPTIQSRHDLLQHFVVSSALTVLAGPQVSEAAGILKEMNDANGGSGFSFADLTADLAGITFTTQLQAQPMQLPLLADSFRMEHHTPSVAGLREGLSKEQFQASYGAPSDPRFLAERAAIVQRIQSLGGLKAAGSDRN